MHRRCVRRTHHLDVRIRDIARVAIDKVAVVGEQVDVPQEGHPRNHVELGVAETYRLELVKQEGQLHSLIISEMAFARTVAWQINPLCGALLLLRSIPMLISNGCIG